jgi:hypothetical protein
MQGQAQKSVSRPAAGVIGDSLHERFRQPSGTSDASARPLQKKREERGTRRPLTLLAMVSKRLALAGNSVLKSGEAAIRHPSLLQPDIQVSSVPVPQN